MNIHNNISCVVGQLFPHDLSVDLGFSVRVFPHILSVVLAFSSVFPAFLVGIPAFSISVWLFLSVFPIV